MAEKKVKKVWTVVEVWRGFAESAQVFARKSDAYRLYRRLRRDCNFDENDVQVFETRVVTAPKPR